MNNRRVPEGVPTVNTDWYNYGGITRDVLLVETPDEFITDYFIQLDPNDEKLVHGFLETNLESTELEVTISIPELEVANEFFLIDGRTDFRFEIEDAEYWSLKILNFMT